MPQSLELHQGVYCFEGKVVLELNQIKKAAFGKILGIRAIQVVGTEERDY
jgi:hypothetical protein